MFQRNHYFYCHDRDTGKQESLHTSDHGDAERIVFAKNEALRQPGVNLQIARAYLKAADPRYATRTWEDVFAEIMGTKTGTSLERWKTAFKDPAFTRLKATVVTNSDAALFLEAMRKGGNSTNEFLRRLHNFACDMHWLLEPVIPKRQWPKIQPKPKRAITAEEHAKIVAREPNLERKAFYELCWHMGASQGDIAKLHAEDIDWEGRVINFERCKTRWLGQTPPQIRFEPALKKTLLLLPQVGPLFPYLIQVRSGDRATEFKQRCDRLGIKGVTLHSYRYAWAERAKTVGYPERFAMVALGHNSKAVARAYLYWLNKEGFKGNPPKNKSGLIFALRDVESNDLIAHVVSGSPADEAGIRNGDVLLKINGEDISDWKSGKTARFTPLAEQPAGTAIRLSLKRDENHYETVIKLRNIFEPIADQP